MHCACAYWMWMSNACVFVCVCQRNAHKDFHSQSSDCVPLFLTAPVGLLSTGETVSNSIGAEN